MKKVLYVLVLSLLFLIPGIHANVNAIVFDLNTVIEYNGGNKGDSVQSVFGVPTFGTITLEDNTTDGGVDINVDLVGDSVHKALAIYLNYDSSTYDSGSLFALNSGIAVSNVEDGQQADGYTAGKFDLQIPGTGNLSFEPFKDRFSSPGALTAADFDFTETSGIYFAAVHIGDFGGQPGIGGGDSIWIGATQKVPEPATMLLFII